ncbi:hypothetical protein EVAR_94038_1 [Eumeta japonica]|uniref:Chitin-binding type-2 domain-containing protein n=1 Tax=Eumeta variegata TaxID=151549 RepID=A0A4C1V6X6_EUMVA|nr:hypothetical protein EVAR_94038_1 [Eumeta japonica]
MRFFFILSVIPLIGGVQEYDTAASDSLPPRVNGRTMKLYGHQRPQPVRCLQDGFQADPVDCTVFYRCVSAGRSRYNVYRCGPGTIYDPEIEICNHQQNTKRSECGIIPIPSLQSVQSNHDNEIDFELPAPFPLSTSKSTTVDKLTEKTTITSSKTTTPIHQPLANYISFETFQPSANNICSKDGFTGDNKDCSKFYRCVSNGRGGYIQYEFTCSEGTIWDEELQACNHPWATKRSKCQENIKQVENKHSSYLYTPPMSDPPIYTLEHSIVQDQIRVEFLNNTKYGERVKKKQDNDAVRINEYFINKDIITTTANYFFTRQPAATNIVPANNDKLYPYNYLNSFSENVSSEQHTQEKVYNTTKSPLSDYNKSKCIVDGFMGDQNDQRKFYRCVDDGKGGYSKYEFSCGEGTVWDSKIESCNHAWQVNDYDSDGNNLGDNSTRNNTVIEMVTQAPITRQPENENENNYNYNEPEFTTIRNYSLSYTTEQSTSNSNLCKSSGFIGDINDCKKFYRCVDDGKGNFMIYEFSCGQGTGWDPKIEACNHMWAIDHCHFKNENKKTTLKEIQYTENELTGSENSVGHGYHTYTVTSTSTYHYSDKTDICTKEGFVGDPDNCKKFYRCVNNEGRGFIQYEFSCGEGTIWDSEINSCNHEKDVKNCNKKQSLNSSKEESSSTITFNEEVSTSKPTTITVENKSPGNNSCTSDGFFPDHKNCTKFYRCVSDEKGGYTKYEFVCGEGTVWDDDVQSCNHKSENRMCEAHTTKKPMQTNQIGTTAMMSESTSTIKTSMVSMTSNSDFEECTDEGFYANMKDCKKFYRCVRNDKGSFLKYDFTCGEGTVWIQEIQSCDHKTNFIDCKNGNSIISSSTISAENIPETSVVTISQSTNKQEDEYPTESVSTHKPSKGNRCMSEGYFGNEEDCKKFYRCVDNGSGGFTKYNFVCGEGTAWDTDLQTCNHENKIQNCKHFSSGTKPTETYENDIDDSKTTDKLSDTTTMKSSSKLPQEYKSDKCDQEGYFGNKKNCKKFYRCVDNGNGMYTKYDFDCGEGTIWDQDITACNHPRDVVKPTCEEFDKEDITTKSPEPQTTSQISSSASSTVATNNVTEKPSDCSKNDSFKDTSVNCPKEGFYANPCDCKKFYRCVDWDGTGEKFSVYHFDCGEGTIWDPALETCNYEDSVYPRRDCTCKQSVSETTLKTTTQEFTTQEEMMTQQTTQKEITTTETTTTQVTTQSETITSENDITTQRSTTEQETIETEPTTQGFTTQEETTTQLTTHSFETEQPTTGKETTTQDTTKESETTTQETTPHETTTYMTTAIESSTQESTIKEETTTKQSTKEQESTTQEITTEQEATTQEFTTEQEATTQEFTTEQELTTQQTATEQEVTTQESSTESESSVEHSTTEQESTTQETTTQQYITTEQQSTTSEEMTTQVSTESSTDETNTENSTHQYETDGTTPEEHTTESSSHKQCPEIDDDQYLFICETGFRRHHKYCNLFYQCSEEKDTYEVKIAVFTCPNNTIYDETKIKCVDESEADEKCDGKTAERRRYKHLHPNSQKSMVVSRDLHRCTASGHYPFEKGNECSSVFMNCVASNKGEVSPYLYRCPTNYVYWSVSRRCEPIAKLAHCRNLQKDWSRRREIPIERINIAT